jgi:fructuronate reductase
LVGIGKAANSSEGLERYANPALKHRCAQIAMDGSQKIPPRPLATISARLAAGQPFTRLALAVAAWMMFLYGHADDGTGYEISDPLASRLKTLAASAHGETQALMDALLSVCEVFPADLVALPAFRKALHQALLLLQAKGARGAIDASQ